MRVVPLTLSLSEETWTLMFCGPVSLGASHCVEALPGVVSSPWFADHWYERFSPEME